MNGGIVFGSTSYFNGGSRRLWGTTSSDNNTQAVRAGVTSTGRLYSTEGV